MTRTYVHDDSPSRTSRFMRVTGISPWDQRRFMVSAWIFAVLLAFGQSPVLGWVLVGLTVAVLGARRLLRREPPALRPAVPVGPAWCDHCADWTVHPTVDH